MAGERGHQIRMLRDFVTPTVQGIAFSITRTNMEANDLELKPALFSMLQQSQFGTTPLEDPNLLLLVFLEMCDTLKLNGASTDAIWLRLFPFSLRDKATAWLHSLPPGCITIWDELAEAFPPKFFPSSKMMSLWNQITTFAQREDKSIYDGWEQLKDLLRLGPHHGLQRWMIVQAFYDGVT